MKFAKPLEGLLVLDFSQFLAGPAAALRLGDLGARVIKVERPQVGDLSRQLYISNLELDGAILTESAGAPKVGEHTESIKRELLSPPARLRTER